MSALRTKRNFVLAYEPLPEDKYADINLMGLDMSGNQVRKRLLTQPIDQYQAAVKWALSMADQMASPIEVIPLTADEYEQRCDREALARGGIQL